MVDEVGKWAWPRCPLGVAWSGVGGARRRTRAVGHERNGEGSMASLGMGVGGSLASGVSWPGLSLTSCSCSRTLLKARSQLALALDMES